MKTGRANQIMGYVKWMGSLQSSLLQILSFII